MYDIRHSGLNLWNWLFVSLLTPEPFSNIPHRFWLIFCIVVEIQRGLPSQSAGTTIDRKHSSLYCQLSLICHWKGHKMISHLQTMPRRSWRKSLQRWIQMTLVPVHLPQLHSPARWPGVRHLIMRTKFYCSWKELGAPRVDNHRFWVVLVCIRDVWNGCGIMKHLRISWSMAWAASWPQAASYTILYSYRPQAHPCLDHIVEGWAPDLCRQSTTWGYSGWSDTFAEDRGKKW